MKDILDLKESLEDARIFQDFGIEPAFSIYEEESKNLWRFPL